jgi:hypothetical protein
MEYLVPYFVGFLLMLAIQRWVQHRYKQYYKFVLYITLVVSGAYKFSQYVIGPAGFVYVLCLTLAMALLAALITRTALLVKTTGAKEV